jgi:hypothetical protein
MKKFNVAKSITSLNNSQIIIAASAKEHGERFEGSLVDEVLGILQQYITSRTFCGCVEAVSKCH